MATVPKTAKTTPTFYIFHGSDEFSQAETLLEFKRKLGPPDMVDLNTTELDGTRITWAELRQACDAIPFLAEKRLVIVRGLLTHIAARTSSNSSSFLDRLVAYLPQLPPTTRLVFIESAALPAKHPIIQLARRTEQGYVKRFEPPKDQALPGWVRKRVRQHGGEITGEAAKQLADVVGRDLRRLDQEIVKLVTYTAAQRPITGQDVEALVPYLQEAIVFDMVDALGRRDGRTAARTLHRLLESGEHPHGLFGMIVRQFRLLIQVHELKAQGATPVDVARKLKLHPFPAKKLYRQADHFTAGQLKKIYRHLLATDVAIKTGQLEAEVALDLLVAGLAVSD